MPFITTAALVGAGIAGSIGSAAIASHAAGKAASAQSNAATSAAQLQAQSAKDSLDFQKQEWQTQQQNMAPWLQAGKGALGELSGLTSTPGQGLLTPWTQQFQAPTDVTQQNDPGYQFRLQQGMQALNNSAAAKGNLLSGNTLEAQQQYGQNYASNEYNNVYNRALQQYQQNYGIFENNQANEYNRLAGLAGTGQTAATSLGQEGQAAAQNVGNTYLTSAAQQGQSLQNAGAATASGYIGGANAWSGALGGAANSITQGIMLNQLMGKGADPSGLYSNYNPNIWVNNG
jgi:hypothetical protein